MPNEPARTRAIVIWSDRRGTPELLRILTSLDTQLDQSERRYCLSPEPSWEGRAYSSLSELAVDLFSHGRLASVMLGERGHVMFMDDSVVRALSRLSYDGENASLVPVTIPDVQAMLDMVRGCAGNR